MLKTGRLPQIQSLRALSVLLVILYHFGFPVPNGFIGVDIFFVISGYVITKSLLNRKETCKWNLVKSFYFRRIKRLFPAFIFCFIITTLSVIAFVSPNQGHQQNSLKTSFFALFGLSNYSLPRWSGGYFDTSGTFLNPYQHTWSLSVEEQFYLFFPFLFIFLISSKSKFNRFRFGILIIFIFLSLTSIQIRQVGEFGLPSNAIYFSTVARLWEFLLGVVACIYSDRFRFINKKYQPFSGFFRAITIFLLVVFAIYPGLKIEENMYLLIIPTIASSLYLLTITENSTHEKPKFGVYLSQLVQYVGNSSYSLYLWHWPIWVMMNIILLDQRQFLLPLSALLTLLFGHFSYRYVEKFLEPKLQQNGSRIIIFFGLGQLVAITVLIVATLGATKGWGKDWSLNSHVIVQANCDSNSLKKVNCAWNSQNSELMVLVGDSMAWAIGNPIIEFARRNSLRLETFVSNGCPPARRSEISTGSCPEWQSIVAERIIAMKPRIVVLASSYAYSSNDNLLLGRFIADLVDSEIPTMLVLPSPGGDKYSERKSLLFSPGAPNRQSPFVSRDFKSPLGLSKKAVNAVKFFDPSKYLCENGLCKISVRGHEFYSYGGHLSPYGSQFLSEKISAQLNELFHNHNNSNTKSASR